MDKVDCVIAGAGVVGLAIARAMAATGRDVLVIEPETLIGSGTSSRNSEVIHAGLYYAEGSLKARLCIAGRDALYRYCAERAIAHRRCGKLIVATDPTQLPALARIHASATACGVTSLVAIGPEEAMAMEPALACVAALHSPQTGIIDSHALMLSFQADAEADGAGIVFNTEIVCGDARRDGVRLLTRDRETGDEFEIAADLFVNAAGLGAPTLARAIDGLDPARVPRQYLSKGNYFAAPGRGVFSRLIYPVPFDGGLGVHLTMDLGGSMRFGPDVEWIETVDYRVDPARARGFYDEIRRYWPDLPDDSLQPAYSGIRPKLSGPGMPTADFIIHGPETHGAPGVIGLYGIESPGLTASLAIADHVLALAGRRG
ncbi:NAD(P)/FAD-dependent oxidoreductase [Ensifer soli]|uniref:NAD(P)/FAD-dependent oxidoreductase n=1 Tax=Ciceribacter sp. sgz301302 TaxID=3342379 RepID=UPI0035B8E3B8